jgi:hypothetical protein
MLKPNKQKEPNKQVTTAITPEYSANLFAAINRAKQFHARKQDWSSYIKPIRILKKDHKPSEKESSQEPSQPKNLNLNLLFLTIFLAEKLYIFGRCAQIL